MTDPTEIAAHLLIDGIAHGQPPYARAPSRTERWPRMEATLALAWRDHEREQLVLGMLDRGEIGPLEPRWYNRGRYELETAAWDAAYGPVLVELDEDALVVSPGESLAEMVERMAPIVARLSDGDLYPENEIVALIARLRAALP